jgi:hypothetical protein
MPNQFDAQLTPASPADVAGTFVWAYGQVFNTTPNQTDWLYPLAQSALETAHWTAMWNYNAGNITTTGDYIVLPGNSRHFKPYDTLGAGCLDMVHWLNSHHVMRYADSGDLGGYVDQLKATNYAGDADYGKYQAGMQRYVALYGNLNPAGYVPSGPAGYVPSSGPEGGSAFKRWALFGVGAATLTYFYETGDLERLYRRYL